MNWLEQGDRPNLNSRGIENGGFLCYQSSVLQALLHQPPLLQFLRQHDPNACPFDECLKCFIKQLVEDYWGPDHTHRAIGATDDPESIANLSYDEADGQRFQRNAQEDAHDFYIWVIDALSRQSP